MINQQLYIGDDLIDLYQTGSKSVIATTVKGFEIGNLITRNANSTNVIKVPPTQNNRRLLGLNDEHSTESTPYTTKKARLIQNGIEVIHSGVAIVQGFNGMDYEVSIFSGIYDLFKQIDGINVDDMDFGEYQVIDDAYIDSIRLSTTLFSAPVFDWGNFFPSPQILKNDSFVTDMSPWTNENRNYPLESLGTVGDRWDIGIGSPTYPLNIGYESTDSNLNQTGALRQGYRFFKNFTYRVQVTGYFTSLGNATYGNLRVDARSAGGEFVHIIDESSIALTTVITFDNTFTATRDFDFIEITALSLVAAGEADTVNLLKIKITDESGVIDVVSPYYIPLVSYSQVVKKIINNAGYALSLDMQDEDYYNKLFVSYSKQKYEYPERLIDKMTFNYSSSGSQIITTASAAKQKLSFTTKNKLGDYAWYNGVDTYAVPNIGYNIQVTVKAIIIVDVVLSGSDNVGLFFELDGLTYTQTETVVASGQYVFTFESNVVVAGITPVSFDISTARVSGSGSNTVRVVSGNLYVNVDPSALETINLSALVLPTIPQSKFLADFFFRFGIIPEENNNIITCTESNNTIRRRLSKDWTYKRDHGIETAISYQLSGYNQSNVFSDIISEKIIVQDASASLDISNNTLPNSDDDYYTSVMSTCEQNLNNGIQICRINFFDRIESDGLGTFDTNPRLFYLRGPIDTDAAVKYNSVVKTDYLLAVYNDPLVSRNTTWKYFLNNYYQLLTTALQKAKTVTNYYTLNDVDVSNISVSQLIFDNGADYLIVNINNYVPGQKTKVDLFKVS